MDELTLLRTLRNEVTEPSDERLAPARARLEAMMRGEGRRAKPARTPWILAAAAGAAVLTLVGGNLHMTAQSAEAAAVLRAAADSITFTDPTPGPGQYLLSRTRANWAVMGMDENGVESARMNLQTLDVYVPFDPADEWVLDRDWGDVGPGGIEVTRAHDGHFYGGPWLTEDLDKLPRGDGQELLAHFDSQYGGGSASRDEDNFVRIVDLLRSGLVPADLRAGLYEALALIPGVNSTDGVANLDGKVGVAIGRTEWLRGGSRQEIIIDPTTGLVIGERHVFTIAAFGFGVNNVTTLTAVETSVVDTAP
jgi:hypothetical protein